MFTNYDKVFMTVGICLFIISYLIYFLINGNLDILDIVLNISLFIIWLVGSISISNFISYY